MRLSFAVFVTSFGSGPLELCCCLVVVSPFEDRVLMIASQVKAFDDELAELRRSHSAAASAAAAQAAASSAAAAAVQAALHHEVSALKSQIEALHNQSDGNTALLDAKAQLQSTVAEIGAKNVALATVQQLALDLERESENLTSQLAAATAEGAAKDRTVVELRDGAAALEQQLAAVKVDLQSATDSANARDEALRNVQQVVADMEIEISGLKHDFAMFRKMMHGQGMSEQQLAQIRPRDVTNAEHMEIFSTICTLNELIISAREAAKQPAVDRDKLLQLEGVTRTLTDKLKETESALTVELERSWEMAKRVAELEEDNVALQLGAREAAVALASKDSECSWLMAQSHDLNQQLSQLNQLMTQQIAVVDNSSVRISQGVLSPSSAVDLSQVLQDKNLQISELRIEISALKIDIGRLAAASLHRDARSSREVDGVPSDRLSFGRNSSESSIGVVLNDSNSTLEQSNESQELLTRRSQDSSASADTARAIGNDSSQVDPHANPQAARNSENALQEKCTKLQSQNEDLKAHVKSLYLEIKGLRLQQYDDAALVQKLEHMETLNVELMKQNAAILILKQDADQKLEAQRMVIEHLKHCTMELDAQVLALGARASKAESDAASMQTLAASETVRAAHSERGTREKTDLPVGHEIEHASHGALQQLASSQVEVRALSRMLNEAIAAGEQKEFDFRLQISELKSQVSELDTLVSSLEMRASYAEQVAAEAKTRADSETVCAADIEASKRELEIANGALDARCAALSALIDAAEKDAAGANERAVAESARAAELQKSRSELESLVAGLKDQLAASKKEADAARQQAREYQSLAAADAARAADALAQTRSELESAVADLKGQLEAARKDANAAKTQAEDAKFQMGDMQRRAAAEIASGIEFERSRNDALVSAVDRLKEQLATALAAAALVCDDDDQAQVELQSQISGLKDVLAQSQQQVAQYRLHLDELTLSCMQLTDSNAALEARAACADKTVGDASALSETLAARIKELECVRDDLESAVEGLRLQLAGEASEGSRAKRQVAQLHQRVAELEANNATLDASLGSRAAAAEKDSSEAQARAAAAAAAAAAEAARVHEVERSRIELQVEVAGLQAQLGQSIEAIGLLTQRVAEQDAYVALVESRASAAEKDVADLRVHASADAAVAAELEESRVELENAVAVGKAQLAAAMKEADALRQQVEGLKRFVSQVDAQLVAVEARASAAETHASAANASAESLQMALDELKAQHAHAAAAHHSELVSASERLAAADLSIAFIRSSAKGKDDTIKMLRAECEQLTSKVAPALVSDAAAAGLKVALHEANTQRASLMKSLSDSQKKISELTSEGDALSINVAQVSVCTCLCMCVFVFRARVHVCVYVPLSVCGSQRCTAREGKGRPAG